LVIPASLNSATNSNNTKEEYNASVLRNDYNRWLELFVYLMEHTGDYSREEAIETINESSIRPDMLSFDSAKPAAYPNGRVFTGDVIHARLSILSKVEISPDGLPPHTDTLSEFPYLGTPHAKKG
jgi:hypothetical protein